MNVPRAIQSFGAALLLLGLAFPVRSQDAPAAGRRPRHSRLLVRLSDQSVLLPVSSIEWGTPDRWSLTSRYVYMFDKSRDHKAWLNNITITLSPGTGGGRFGIGYQGVFSRSELAILTESRVVLLRTWGNSFGAGAHSTFAGAEIRGSLSGIINLGVGYYRQISAGEGHRDSYWGFHVGVGI